MLKKGKELLVDFIPTESQDYQELAENLKAQNSALIKSCTMKGESHDELHKWLHPHLELTNALAESESAEEAEEIVSELQQSFKIYQNYFE
jgi:glycine cleavage system protein P-like pyridoxal-binding family